MAKESSIVKRPLFSNQLMPGALSAELFGTFILCSVVLASNGNVIVAALTVLIFGLVLSKISGGHLNPAITLALFATRQISAWKTFGYIVAQLLGAMLALIVATKFLAGNPEAMASGAEVFKIQVSTATWVPLLAELLGGAILGLGVGAAFIGKKEGLEAAFSVGGALLIGLIVATIGSAAILNPAAALSLTAYMSNANMWWAVGAYAFAPIIGVVAGTWLYKLMQWDIMGTIKKAAK